MSSQLRAAKVQTLRWSCKEAFSRQHFDGPHGLYENIMALHWHTFRHKSWEEMSIRGSEQRCKSVATSSHLKLTRLYSHQWHKGWAKCTNKISWSCLRLLSISRLSRGPLVLNLGAVLVDVCKRKFSIPPAVTQPQVTVRDVRGVPLRVCLR